MLLYIVAYDIPSNRRRKKISDLLEGYGRRVQYSVFELMLSPAKYAELRQRLRRYPEFLTTTASKAKSSAVSPQ